MGANSSSSTYYEDHVVSFIDTVSSNIRNPKTQQFSYRAWSGRNLTADIIGTVFLYPVDTIVTCQLYQSNYDAHTMLMLTMESPWPDEYPQTLLRRVRGRSMTNLRVDVDIVANSCYVRTLYNSASSFPSMATPQEKSALSGLVSESLCIVMRILYQSQKINMHGYVRIDAAGSVRIESVNLDKIPHATPKQMQYALREYLATNPLPETKKEQLEILQDIVKTEYVVAIYESMGFEKKSSNTDPTHVAMESIVYNLLTRCRNKYLSHNLTQ